ncbi:MAG: amino acid adenylation domain-containing protein [Deltaproteobacteria bacterium]|nr:amino acid adenylation domain-containing protein [Deltaproteobacteria bacterium]
MTTTSASDLPLPGSPPATAPPERTASSPAEAPSGPSGRSAYPLTAMQAGMLYQARLNPNGGFDLEQLTLDLDEDLDVDAFVQAWQHVVARHPMLRTRFAFEGRDEPQQETLPSWQMPVVVEDWRAKDAALERQTFLFRDRNAGFHLDEAPPLRLLLARTETKKWFGCWSFHHILLDGRSFIVVLRDVFAAYGALMKGQSPALVLPPPPRPFADFVTWTLKQRFSASLPFWKGLLQGKDAPTSLPPLRPGSPHPGAGVDAGKGPPRKKYGEKTLPLPAATATALRLLATTTKTTLGTVVQGAWALCLNRLTGDDDVVFGTTRACRRVALDDHSDDGSGLATAAVSVADMVGLFINTLPVRARVVDDETVAAFLQGLRQQSLDVRDHEHTPLVDVLGQADVPRGTALFHTLLMFENQELNAALRAEDPGFARRHFHYEEQPTFPLNCTIFDGGGTIEVRVLYDRARFADVAIDKLLLQIAQTLLSMTTAKTTGEVRLLAEPDRRAVLFAGKNATTRAFPSTKLIHELFEDRVLRQPSAIAVIAAADTSTTTDTGPRSLTFLELEERANQLATRLRREGAKPGTYVGILLERGVDLVVALLAAAKSGAAYVPLDPDYPEERLAFMLEDTQAPVVVTQQKLQHLLPPAARKSATLVVLDDKETAIALQREPTLRPERTSKPTDVCYTIYTSGSTGQPKGVVLTHDAVVNTLDWVNREFLFTPSDRVLFVTSVCFDLSVFDVFGCLGAGASIRVATGPELKDPEALVKRLTSGEITVWDSAPAALSRLVPFLPTPALLAGPGGEELRKKLGALRLVMLSGDWIPVGLPDQMRSVFPAARIKSLGGATEAAIWSNFFHIEGIDPAWTSIPYGAPIQNSWYHVLDRRLQPVPAGVAGDLYIGGTCLAAGYLKRPELTAEKFIADPFIAEAKDNRSRSMGDAEGVSAVSAAETCAHAPGSRLYKTGDLARYYDDDSALAGELEFLGRADFQVKIRGFRVELGEVDAVILRHPGVRDVLCTARTDASKQKVLVAYVVPKVGVTLSADQVKDHVESKLPDFMVPTHVVVLPDGMPVSVNGKVDRKALPDPLEATASKSQKAPSTLTERSLLPIWQEVLSTQALSVDDNFFDKGGHSLLATLLVSRIKQRLDVQVPLSRLFSANTIEKLARTIDEAGVPREPTAPFVIPAASSLIVLNEKGHQTPVFFIAGIGGHVFTFQKLAGFLGADTPTYGFRAIGGESGEIPKESVEDIATAYLKELDDRGLSKKPIVLCGYSFGGYVAYELALRLQQRGVRPQLLVFFDVLAPGYPRPLPLTARARLHAEEFLKRDLRGRRAYIEQRVDNLRRRLYLKLGRAEELAGAADVGAGVFDEARQQEMRALWGATAQAQVQYKPTTTTPTPTLLLKASINFDWPATRFDDPVHGWRSWVTGDIAIVPVDGAHLKLFEGDNPERMASAIRRALSNP